jgi:hypothetical protein
VGRDYFDSTGIPIVLGRRFQREDENDGAGRIIVSEALAHEFWGSENPLGRSIEIAENQDTPGPIAMLPRTLDDRPGALESGRRLFEVVGVAGDVAEGPVVQKPRPTVYFALTPADYRYPTLQGITLIVRTAPGFDAITAVRQEISAMDSRVTPFDVRTMREQINRFMAPLKTTAWTYHLLWVFGLLLAAVGLAGTTAYSVAQRSREIGIRMALGARKHNVLGLGMREGGMMIAVGLTLGGAGAAVAQNRSGCNSAAGVSAVHRGWRLPRQQSPSPRKRLKEQPITQGRGEHSHQQEAIHQSGRIRIVVSGRKPQ